MKALIADDHWIARSGLTRVIERLDDKAEIVEADNAAEALRLAKENHDLDLILFDLIMAGSKSLDEILELRTHAPNAAVVVVSMVEDRADILRAIDLGAWGYIPKTASAEEMLRGLQVVLSGEIYFPHALFARSAAADRAGGGRGGEPAVDPKLLQSLTRRHRQVLDGLAQGKTNAEIAEELQLSTITVRQHVSSLLRRLGLSNRTQAAVFASQLRSR
ncbi:MAG: response regulator transcription factor [Minwuiales bacterium]|nr:response regulator transcription factor [Minwuiales bacterium]